MFYLTVGCPAQEKDLAREILAKFAQVHKLLIHEGHRSCEILIKFAQVHATVNSSCVPPPPPPSSYHRAFARLFSPGGGAFANFDYDKNPNTSLLESCKLINDVEISFSKFEYKDCNITLSLAKDTSEPKTSVYYSWRCARVH